MVSMRLGRLALCGMVGLATGSYSDELLACGVLPTPYVTIASVAPEVGATGVPTDAPLVITGTGWVDSGSADPGTVSERLQSGLTVEVTSMDGGETFQGTISTSFGGTAVWVPSSPLPASSMLVAHVTMMNSMAPDKPVTGSLDATTTFTTGASPMAPLALEGGPTFEFSDGSFSSCAPGTENDCGTCANPTSMTMRSVTFSATRVTGGYIAGGYSVTAWVESGAGVDPGSVKLDDVTLTSGQTPVVLHVPIPDKGTPYQVCLHVDVADAREIPVSTVPVCFEAAAWQGATGSGGSGGSSAGGVDTPAPAAADSGGSSGCSFGGTAGSAGWMLVLLGAVASRRRRSAASREP